MKIIPAILTGSASTAERQLSEVAADGRLELVQLDVIDGWFADNLTLTPVDYSQISFASLEAEFHLMTEEPLDYVFELLEYQHQIPVRSVIGQVERMSHQTEFIQQIKGSDWQAGLSVDLFTPLESLEPEALLKVDVVQLMAIEAGFQGQELVDTVFEKITELQELREALQVQFTIAIDGGVKVGNLARLKQAGVDAACVGSALWQSASFTTALDDLMSIAE